MTVRKIYGIMLAVSFAIGSAVTAKAGERLSGHDLNQLFPGEFQAVVQGKMAIGITAQEDGVLVAHFLGVWDSGHWAVRGERLCIQFSKWLDSRTICSAVVEDQGWYKTTDVAFRKTSGFALVLRNED